MPWKKVLGTKNFMHCHNNILFEKILPVKRHSMMTKNAFGKRSMAVLAKLPDPDMYIDAIDWNPYIDPERVRELDREYFHPDDKNCLLSCSTKPNNGWPDDASNPMEFNQNTGKTTGSNERNHQQVIVRMTADLQNHRFIIVVDDGDRENGWNQWDNAVNDRYKSSKHDDPCESHTQGNATSKDITWVETWQKSWDAAPRIQNYQNNNINLESAVLIMETDGGKSSGIILSGS